MILDARDGVDRGPEHQGENQREAVHVFANESYPLCCCGNVKRPCLTRAAIPRQRGLQNRCLFWPVHRRSRANGLKQSSHSSSSGSRLSGFAILWPLDAVSSRRSSRRCLSMISVARISKTTALTTRREYPVGDRTLTWNHSWRGATKCIRTQHIRRAASRPSKSKLWSFS